MNSMQPRKRRGLSSIIGALFFIILMIGTFTALLAAFSYQNDLINTQKKLSDHQTAIAHEDFSLAGNTISNKLYVTVKNQGTDTVNIRDLWIIEKNTASKLATPYKINFTNATIAVASSKNITKGQFTLNPSNLYTIKVVSDLGTIRTIDVPDLSTPTGPQGQQGQACWDVNNDGQKNFSFSPSPYCVDGQCYTTEDQNSDTYINTLDCAGQNGASDTTVLHDELLNKPEIFLMFPSPFGALSTSTTSTGVWGAIVANPSENDMEVKKIVITTVLTGAASGETSFVTSCPPGTSSEWTCSVNQLVWKSSTPTTIPSRSVKNFKISPYPVADTGLTNTQNGMPVFASVLTGYGQFGKTNYLSSMIKGSSNSIDAPIVNVYRSDSNSEITTDVHGTLNIAQSVPFTTYFTISENNTSTQAFLNSGSELIVNIPKGFTSVTATSVTSGVFSPITISGNSTQGWLIDATLTQRVGDGVSGHKDARSIAVTATAPALNPSTKSKLYVMYTLADGQASYKGGTSADCLSSPQSNCLAWQVGPLAEIVARVNP